MGATHPVLPEAVAFAPLTDDTLFDAVGELAARDPRLARIVDAHGPPPLWAREPGFATLLYIILEQQVSLASARAAYNRLADTLNPLTPGGFLELDDATLLRIGFSRQKARYGRGLASAILSGTLNLDNLHELEDDAARVALMRVVGIGRWTADIYLLEALLRPDVWPVGDLALAVAAHQALGLPTRPTLGDLESLGELWRPWRAVAARLLWHDYLSRRGQTG
jgi:DNA-3-methyladenine glycosylase II